MKNYMDKIYTVEQFKQDNPALAKQTDKALQYLKQHINRSEDTTFAVIEVESYKCLAYLTDESPLHTQ